MRQIKWGLVYTATPAMKPYNFIAGFVMKDAPKMWN